MSIRIGVIGTGSISEFHLSSYAANKSSEVYAICDLNRERAEAVAAKFGASKVFTDYNELLADPDVDAVSICTWNNTHAEISIAALEAGKHVLVEKPLCRTVEEALQIQETVRKTGKKLMVGYVRRYDPNAMMLNSFVEEGEFGDLYFAKASYIRRMGNPGGWFSDKSRSGGGPVIDIGVHVIDLCWYLMGRPKVKSVSANEYKHLGNRANVKHLTRYMAADYNAEQNDVEDMANALIRFENGASLLVDVSFSLHSVKDEGIVKLFGTKGGFEIDPAVVMVTEKHDTIMNISPQTDSSGLQIGRAFQSEIDHFVDCIVNDKQPISPVEDGVEVMKILCAIYESAAKGAEVTFS
ncbi:Gfo/Idh/MocA family oxidoreductase [Paenibacillus pasadenensis]|uniref:Gfo/Idh/MocA family protein n=1 Tax=Paenibacillus pasadenensis TaxID=217090 RepID=UPI00203A3E6D|nr:Gfo/Idh/MocA family oxidoreductase [Paenibacillus pasadenensis]MCM3748666.1 Gfo/Idh/MocA family oxidoreductase [Paenibacillus pasadenensis]